MPLAIGDWGRAGTGRSEAAIGRGPCPCEWGLVTGGLWANGISTRQSPTTSLVRLVDSRNRFGHIEKVPRSIVCLFQAESDHSYSSPDMTELKTIGRRPAAKKTHASATSLDRLIWTFRFALLLAIFCTAPKAGAQVKTTSSNTGVVDQGSKDVLPPKPANLTQVPVAKIESDDGSPYSRQMVSYLVSLFNRAGRPRITEGENFDYVIRASVVNPPELEEYSSGHIANGKLLKEIGGKFLNPRLFSGGVENIDFNNTNLMTVTHCGVELRLLNKDKEIIVLRTAQVGSTNSLRALSLELNGISSGDPSGDVDTFKRKVSKGTFLQALVNLAAYSAATNFLPAADVHFVQAKPTQPTKALPVSSTNVAPPVATPPAATGGPATVARAPFCSHCGTKMAADIRFCSGCGAKVTP